jgi:hypothetical protein
MLKVFKANSKIQKLTQKPLLPHRLQRGLWQQVYSNINECTKALEMPTKVIWVLAEALRGDVRSMLRSCPAARELLLSPEIVSCLAITSSVTVLGPDVSSDGGTGAAAMQSASNSSSGPRSGGRAGRQTPGAAGQQQQQSGNAHSGSGLDNGVRLDSPAPLSLT